MSYQIYINTLFAVAAVLSVGLTLVIGLIFAKKGEPVADSK